MPDIAVINRSTEPDTELAAIVKAVQIQVARDFAPAWLADAALHLVGAGGVAPAGAWPLWVLDDDDGASGDLGWHAAAAGLPYGRIFAGEDRKYGCALSVTISHEILEMLADPGAERMAHFGPLAYPIEVCDPVESDADGYQIDGVPVSDFVLPSYFGMPGRSAGSPYDFACRLTAGCPTLRPGGYIERWDGVTWRQVRARQGDGRHSYRSTRRGRIARRLAQPVQGRDL